MKTKDITSGVPLSYEIPGGLALDFLASGPAQVDEKAMTATCVFSASSIDRIGDRMHMDGIDTTNHRLAPVVFWNHGKVLTLPIGRTMTDDGTYTVNIGEDIATQTTRFSQKLLEAEQIFALIAEKMIWSNSIGYRAIDAKPLYIDGRRAGLDLRRVELLECSWVGVGMHQDAVRAMLGRKSICGKPLAEPLRHEFKMFAGPAPVWSPGVDLYSIKSVDEAKSQLDDMGDDAARMDLLADIIGGLISKGDFGTKEWTESAHHRGQPGNAGQFGPGGGGGKKPESKKPANSAAASAKPAPPGKKTTAKPSAARAGSKQAQAAASEAIKGILSGAITKEKHGELVGHLSKLTVPQLQELRKEHGLQCSGKLKAQVIEKLTHHFNSKIIKEGTVDVDKVAAALKPFAGERLDANTSRFAKADYLSIRQQYGTLAVQRIKELAVDTLKTMKELPAGEERDGLRKKLGVYSWMTDQAKRDGITGKVEPSNLQDFKANVTRIALAEKLKGTPWTAFLINSIQHHFDVGDRSPEQCFHDLKAGMFKGPRLDAALKNLRADYGSMTAEQLQKVLPRLKGRTDTITSAITKRAA